MPVYRTTLFFAGRAEGWSESHMLSTNLLNPIDCFAIMNVLAQKRADLLGLPYTVIGFRVSAYLDALNGPRSARAVKSSKQTFVQSNQSGTGDAEPGPVCLNMVGDTTPGKQTNLTQLGAPSDAAVQLGGAVVLGAGNLQNNFNALKAFLITPQVGSVFGWGLSQSPAISPLIQGIVANVNGTVQFTMPAATFVAPFGTPLPVRISRVNQGTSPLNGQLTIIPLNATTANTVEVIGLARDQIGGQMRIYNPIRPFTPYAALNLQGLVGNHKRGRPFGSPRGRAPKRVRG